MAKKKRRDGARPDVLILDEAVEFDKKKLWVPETSAKTLLEQLLEGVEPKPKPDIWSAAEKAESSFLTEKELRESYEGRRQHDAWEQFAQVAQQTAQATAQMSKPLANIAKSAHAWGQAMDMNSSGAKSSPPIPKQVDRLKEQFANAVPTTDLERDLFQIINVLVAMHGGAVAIDDATFERCKHDELIVTYEPSHRRSIFRSDTSLSPNLVRKMTTDTAERPQQTRAPGKRRKTHRNKEFDATQDQEEFDTDESGEGA